VQKHEAAYKLSNNSMIGLEEMLVTYCRGWLYSRGNAKTKKKPTSLSDGKEPLPEMRISGSILVINAR
jgi:hypothetical protein